MYFFFLDISRFHKRTKLIFYNFSLAKAAYENQTKFFNEEIVHAAANHQLFLTFYCRRVDPVFDRLCYRRLSFLSDWLCTAHYIVLFRGVFLLFSSGEN